MQYMYSYIIEGIPVGTVVWNALNGHLMQDPVELLQFVSEIIPN